VNERSVVYAFGYRSYYVATIASAAKKKTIVRIYQLPESPQTKQKNPARPGAEFSTRVERFANVIGSRALFARFLENAHSPR